MKKKVYYLMVIIILLIGLVSGCGTKETTTVKNVSVKSIADKISQGTDITNMKEANAEKLNKLYGISENDVEEFSLYAASSNILADQIAIFKVKDVSNVDVIKGQIDKKIDKLSKDFKDYLPAEYDKIQKNIVSVKGNYILFVISNDSEKISKIFEDELK